MSMVPPNLNSGLIQVGQIVPPQSCCPQTPKHHTYPQKAHEGYPEKNWEEQDQYFGAHISEISCNQEAVWF